MAGRIHKRQATPLYLCIIEQLRDRIAWLGWPMWVCDSKSGLQDGYTAKVLNPDTPSGRMADWPTLQLLIDALYPDGFQLVAIPRTPRRRYKGNRQARLPLGLEKLPAHPASERKGRRKPDPSPVIRVRVAPREVGQVIELRPRAGVSLLAPLVSPEQARAHA